MPILGRQRTQVWMKQKRWIQTFLRQNLRLASNCVFVFVCTYYMEVDRGNESKARVEDVPDDLFLFGQDLADVYDIP